MLLVSMTTECAKRRDQQASGVILRNQNPPLPHRRGALDAGSGILLGKRLTSSAASTPALAGADASVVARLPGGRQPRGELARRSVLFPSGHPARFSLRGVNSSWVVPHRKAQWGRNVSLPKSVPPSFSFRSSRENQSIPIGPRLSQREGLWVLPVARWGRSVTCDTKYQLVPRKPPGHEGTLCLEEAAVKGRCGESCTPRAGLHRPLLVKQQSQL
ncbi:uncharacterized protein LOC119529205 [Choloepus didactylus]|uniref:uncharacterized protein LOC119529205 n=1 Tax=Choloepus didactylus TaxID=27675 RepID=UPI00189DBC0B|nr:uncharacterized protein LOC119529205 [Choloepus didactylus]